MKKYIKLYKLRKKRNKMWHQLEGAHSDDSNLMLAVKESRKIGDLFTRERILDSPNWADDWDFYPVFVVAMSTGPVSFKDIKDKE